MKGLVGRRHGWGTGACVWLLLAAAACRPSSQPVPAPPQMVVRHGSLWEVPPQSPLRQRLKVAPATCAPVAAQLSAPATIEADPTLMARISPPLPGRVLSVEVRHGDAVRPGQVLLRMDAPDLVAAQSDCLKARSSRGQAQRAWQRQNDLSAHGVGARRELEQAQTDRDIADDELRRAESRLRQLGVDPDHLDNVLSLRSPIGGRVVELHVAPGEVHNDATVALMTIADLSGVWLVAHVLEKDMGGVGVGDKATIAFAAYPGEQLTGAVAVVSDLLDPQSRTIAVRVPLDNPQRRFRPGMFATARFTAPARQQVVVPMTALVIDAGVCYAFVQVRPWVFERRAVTLAQADGDRAVVTSGLAAGDQVVVQDAVLLP